MKLHPSFLLLFVALLVALLVLCIPGQPADASVTPYVRLEELSGSGPGLLLASPWRQIAKLIASNGKIDDTLGEVVAVSADGNTIVASARSADIGSNKNQGAAYVFARPAGGWGNMASAARLTAANGSAWDYFGNKISVSAGGRRFYGHGGCNQR